jgi:hypothetical protein
MVSTDPLSTVATARTRGMVCRTGIGVAVVLLLLAAEPALANKFETIGSGVSGSISIKREWLKLFFYIAAGLCALGAILAIVVPHGNALFLNHRNWKTSSAVMGLLAAGFAGAGLAL